MKKHGRQIFILLNEEKADQLPLTEAGDALAMIGHEARVLRWNDAESLRRHARTAQAEGADVVMAAGGDGSLRAVAEALSADGPPTCALGILPLGTGNDFAAACGILANDLDAALRLAAEATPVSIDLGRFGDHFFVNAASGGFGAEVTAETSDMAKKILGRFAYVLTGLLRMPRLTACPARITTPTLSWEGDLFGLTVANGCSAGGGFKLTPNAVLDDGLFDIVLFPALPPNELADLVADMVATPEEGDFDQLITCRAPWIEVETEAPFHINLDGEPFNGTTFRFDIAERCLPMCLPLDAPLLRRVPAAV